MQKGFIASPITHGELSIKKLAKVCFEVFETKSTIQNIERELNPSKNSLSDTKRNFFKIPNVSDLK